MNQMEIKRALVTAVFKERYELNCEGATIYARLKSANYFKMEESNLYPTVGDEVSFYYNGAGDSLILEVTPRKSVFLRLNSTQGMSDQAVAANFDYVFIVMSLNKDFHLAKLERYLTVGWQSGGIPVIVLSKADLCEDAKEQLEAVRACAPKVDVICISAKTGLGLHELEPYLKRGETIVLLGSSGVGKSSLVNALLGKEKMQTGEIREADSQGRHTTTHRQCLFLPDEIVLPDGSKMEGGGQIIDTPGMRKLMVSNIEEGIRNACDDLEALKKKCRFSNCTHTEEPGCAVQAALADGTLSNKRWETYLSMKREERYAKKRETILAMKQSKTKAKYSKKNRRYLED